MLELVQAASRALSVQGADELEQLAQQAARLCRLDNTQFELNPVKDAVQVLTRQVRAAELHLGIRTQGKGNPWAR